MQLQHNIGILHPHRSTSANEYAAEPKQYSNSPGRTHNRTCCTPACKHAHRCCYSILTSPLVLFQQQKALHNKSLQPCSQSATDSVPISHNAQERGVPSDQTCINVYKDRAGTTRNITSVPDKLGRSAAKAVHCNYLSEL